MPVQKLETTESPTLDAPFIIHEEKKIEGATSGKSAFRGFSMPLGFFKPKKQSAEFARPVRAEVEAPAKSERRVVNYSELRTTLSPFEGAQSFINPVRNSPFPFPEKTPVPKETVPEVPAPKPVKKEIIPEPVLMPAAKTEKENKPPEIKPVIPEPEPIPTVKTETEKTGSIVGTIKKPDPKIDGNVIDLKN